MCTAHQSRQPPAPRGLGRPQIGHLELEGKTNHGELWEACLSSQAPAVLVKGRAGGGAGMPWVRRSGAAGNSGAREAWGRAVPDLLAGPLPRLLLQHPSVQHPPPHIHAHLSPESTPGRVCCTGPPSPAPPSSPRAHLARAAPLICDSPSFLARPARLL